MNGSHMRYRTKDIGEGGLEVQVPITAAWLGTECPGVDGVPDGAGLTLKARLEESGDSYLLRGDLRGTLVTPCARCLEPAAVALDIPIIVSYEESDEEEDDDADDDEEGEVRFFTGGEIDLGPELRDEIILAMPIGPLCRPDCAGICSVCGGNRNATPCDCEEKQRAAVTKLSALKDLKI
jgi:uncharacterized metal-binding protein YceD (DUF177 family)